MMKKIFTIVLLGLIVTVSKAQILTKEDSLAAGLQMSGKTTVLSGYGECMVSYNNGSKTANANVTRFVTFFGHRFSKNITLFSEMELEDAKVSSGFSGEISLEQMFLKFDLNKKQYIVAGLFIPRIGIINENHLPTTYNGNDRHYVEKQLIPSTWRELGVGLYGRADRLPGFNYYIGLTNGLSSQNFARNTGIRGGRFEGSNATASNLALSAAALYYCRNFRFQASAYYGGTVGVAPKQADSLQLNSGPFGTPVGLAEVNVQYNSSRFSFKGLMAITQISEANKINTAYANNTPETMLGGFAELGYNLLKGKDFESKKLWLFGRYEWMDLNYRMPVNGIKDNQVNQQYFVAGLTYKPTIGVALKFDVVNRISGTPNQAFVINPFPTQSPYYRNNVFYNLGFAYNF
jgi:hypothetical protein